MSSAYSKEKPNADLRAEYQKFIGRKMLFLISLIFGIILLAGYAATRGSADISVLDVFRPQVLAPCLCIGWGTVAIGC